MHTVRNLALRWSIYKGAADAPFCKSAETVIAPFDKAAGAVDAPPLTKLLGPWMRLLCCLAGARPPLFDKAAGAVDAPPLLLCRSRGSISRPPLLQFLLSGATTSFRR